MSILNQLAHLSTRIFGKRAHVAVLKFFSQSTRNLASFAHKAQMKYEWIVPPQPEWFDHFGDQFFLFRKSQTPLWAERGIFGLLAMKQGADVLELCCGDGFNAYHFYSIRANRIISVDFDKEAIPHASKYNQAKNVEFRLCDIRKDMPEGVFDNIIWDAAIEHFTEAEIADVMKGIKQRLKKDGVLTGYTIVERLDGQKSLSHHEREFRSMDDLKSFIEPHFKHVKVFETIYPVRHNLYFFASDDVLPFDKSWDHIRMNP